MFCEVPGCELSMDLRSVSTDFDNLYVKEVHKLTTSLPRFLRLEIQVSVQAMTFNFKTFNALFAYPQVQKMLRGEWGDRRTCLNKQNAAEA